MPLNHPGVPAHTVFKQQLLLLNSGDKSLLSFGGILGFLLCWLYYYPHGSIIMGLVVQASCSFPHLSGFPFFFLILF